MSKFVFLVFLYRGLDTTHLAGVYSSRYLAIARGLAVGKEHDLRCDFLPYGTDDRLTVADSEGVCDDSLVCVERHQINQDID